MKLTFVAVPALILLAGYPSTAANNAGLQKQLQSYLSQKAQGTNLASAVKTSFPAIVSLDASTFAEQPLLAGINKQTSADREAIKTLINQQFKALNEEKVAAYMETIDRESPAYPMTQSLLGEVFKQYDLKYELKGIDFTNISPKEAKITVTQITTKIKGPAFRDNKLVSLSTLRKINGQWKMYTTEVKNIEYLN